MREKILNFITIPANLVLPQAKEPARSFGSDRVHIGALLWASVLWCTVTVVVLIVNVVRNILT